MAEEIDSLLVKLGLESDEKEFQKANSMFDGLTTKALQFGAIIGGGIGLDSMTRGFAEATDRIGRFADVFSTTPEFVSAMQHAFRQTGGQAEDAFSSIEKVANLIEDTDWGEVPSDAFRVAGFDPMMLQGVNSISEAYERLSGAVNELSPEASRRALKSLGFGQTEIDLFTATGADSLENLLKEGLDLSTINSEMVRQGKEFNQATGRLGTTLEGVSNQLSSMFMDDLTEAINTLSEILRENRDQITDFFNQAMPFLKAAGVGITTLVSLEAAKKTGEFARNLKSGKTGLVGLIAGLGYMAFEDEGIREQSINPLLELVGLKDKRRKPEEGPGMKFDPDRPDLPLLSSEPDTPTSKQNEVNINNEIKVDARGSTNPAETERRTRDGLEKFLNEYSEKTIRDLRNPLR